MIKYDVQVAEKIEGNERDLKEIARCMRERGINIPRLDDVARYVKYRVAAYAEIQGVRKLAFSGEGSKHVNDWRVEPEFKDSDDYNDNEFSSAWDQAYDRVREKEQEALATIVSEFNKADSGSRTSTR